LIYRKNKEAASLHKKNRQGIEALPVNQSRKNIYFGITFEACGPFCPMLFSNSTS
jgi:hypothetical protein